MLLLLLLLLLLFAFDTYHPHTQVCNPTYILGPRLQPTQNESTKGVLKYLNGTAKEITFGNKCVVDVRDVARAHILCYQKVGQLPRTNGCC